MCAHHESIANLVVLRLKTGSLLRSYSSSNIRVCFQETISPPPPPRTLHLIPTLAVPSPLACPRGPTLRQEGLAPAASATGLSRPCVDPLTPPPTRAPLGLGPARLSMNVAPPPGPRPPFSPIAQVSANQAEPAGCSTNGAVSRARAGCHSSDWLDEA